MQAYTGFGSGILIFCHMDELPGHALQAFLQNNRQSSCGCAVKQKGWDFRADFVAARGRNGEERGGLIGTEHTMSYISGASSKCALHVDFTGVPLIGANLQAVRADAQPLFVACSNNFQEIFTRYGVRRLDAFQHQVDRSPSTSLQSSRMPFCIPDLGQVEIFRLVAQLVGRSKYSIRKKERLCALAVEQRRGFGGMHRYGGGGRITALVSQREALDRSGSFLGAAGSTTGLGLTVGSGLGFGFGASPRANVCSSARSGLVRDASIFGLFSGFVIQSFCCCLSDRLLMPSRSNSCANSSWAAAMTRRRRT